MTKQELLQNAVGCLLDDHDVYALFHALHNVIDYEADHHHLKGNHGQGDFYREIAKDLCQIIIKHQLYISRG